MNFRDFEIVRKMLRVAESHRAINRQKAKRPLSRPRATKNITSKDPNMQGI